MQHFIIILSMALAAPPAAAPAPTTERISFEASSWGKPLSAWTVERSGAGRYTASRDAPSGGFRNYDLVTRTFRIAPADYARIESLLRPARAFAGRDLPCRRTVTDQVYGKVRWTTDEQVSFDLGCTSDQVKPIYDNFWEAETLVKRLAGAGTIVETKEVREPGS